MCVSFLKLQKMKPIIVFACVLVCALAVPVPENDEHFKVLIDGAETPAEIEQIADIVRKIRQTEVDIEVVQGKAICIFISYKIMFVEEYIQ